MVVGLLSACGNQPTSLEVTQVSPEPTAPTTTPSLSVTPTESNSPGSVLSPLLEGLPTRTPEPTATPDVISEIISTVVEETGLSERTLLWVRYSDWIDLTISLVVILIGYLVGTWVIRQLLPRLASQTPTNLDTRLLDTSGNQMRWLIVLLALNYATQRLSFVQINVKTFLGDLYFYLGLFLTVRILFSLIRLVRQEAETRAARADRRKESDPFITLSTWTSQIVVIIVAASILLARIGVNITGVAVFLGLVSFVVSLAGRDMLADIIFGAIILMDRSYSVGDRVDLPGLNTWGDVFEIGMRTTKVRLIDNRMVIVPNSQIGRNQIINYSYTDSTLFDQCVVMVSHDNDMAHVRQILIDTIQSVDGVMPERDVGVWMMEFREYAVVFELAWWIESYSQKFNVRNRVTQAIARELRGAEIVMPYPVRDLKVDLRPIDPMHKESK